MKKVLFFTLFLTISLAVFGQQRSVLRGRIVDAATGQPLFGATAVVDSVWNGMAGEDGAFTVTDVPRGTATVEYYSLGYLPVRRTVNFNRATVDAGTVALAADEANRIDEVVVVGVANPVIQMGDTTQFNAAAFKTNPDADAGDLLAKMPGMEVTESGVTAQGEAVARTYVNGELFFGDDAMAALSNLPADLVESIQMFDELPDEARFSGFNDGQTQRALNIVTKGGELARTIDGRLEGAYGRELQRDMDGNYQPRYDIGGRLNYITSKQAINLNGIVNNTNQMRFGSGGGRGGGGGFGGGGGLRTIYRFGANYTTKLSEKSTLNLSYDYNGNENRQNSLTINDYYATEDFDSRITRDTLSSRSSGYEHRFNTRYDYEGERDRLRVQASVDADRDDSRSFGIEQEWRDGADFSLSENNDRSEENDYSVDGMIDWSHRLGQTAGRTIGVQARFEFGGDDSDSEEDSDLTRFYEGNSDPTRIYWKGTGEGFERSFRLSLNYNEPLSERLQLNFNYRPSYNYSSSELLRVDQFGELDSLVSERFTYDYLMHTGRVGLSYNKQDHFNFSISVNAQSASRAQSMALPRDYELERTFTSLLPTFSFRYFIRRTKYFQINYNTGSTLPSLEQLTTMVDVSNPMRYRAGNADLDPDYSHRLNLRYNANNIDRSTNFYANLSGSITDGSIQSRTIYFEEDTVLPEYGDFVFEGGSNLRTYANAGQAASLNAGAGYGFVFRPLKLNVNVGANYTYSHLPSYVGSMLNQVNNNQMMMMLSFNSNISENVDFRAGTFVNYGTTDNPSSPNKETWGQTAFAMANYIFGGGFVFNTNYSLTTSSTLSDPSNVWSASIGHKFLNNALEFRVEVNDILNQSRNYSYTYGAQAETESWNRVMGRYVMARLSYRFNSLRGGGAQGPGGGNNRRGPGGPGGGGYPMSPGGPGGF